MNKARKSVSQLVRACIIIVCISLFPQMVFAQTQQEASDWARSKVDTQIDYDGAYGAQCVDLIFAYYNYFWGVSPVRGNGSDFSHNALPNGWQRIKYYKGFSVEPGDVVIWTWNKWAGNSGHVGIALSGDTNGFTSIEQNAAPKISTFNHKYYSSDYTFWGVIRPPFVAENNDNERVIADGNYKIYSTMIEAIHMCWDVYKYSGDSDVPINLHSDNGQDNQIFNFTYVGNGYYIIKSISSGKFLDVKGGNGEAGSSIIQCDYNGNDNQLWKLKVSDEGQIMFLSKMNNLVIDVYNMETNDSTSLIAWTKNDQPNQWFWVVDAD